MAAKKNSTSKSNGFKEFESKGKNFTYSGRIYTDKKREAGKLTIYPINLCINGLITIKGCSYYETANNCWIGGPQYKSGDEYKDYLYIDKENNEDMDSLATTISEIVSKWTYDPDEDFMTINESLEMPF